MRVEAYHGTGQRFNRFEQSKSRVINDVYGGGVAYFTDDIDIAKGYARQASKRSSGEAIVYSVTLTFNELFDVDSQYSGDELIKMIGPNVEQFARGARLLKLGDDRMSVISELKSGKMPLTGDQVFRGMSNGMMATQQARKKLQQLGYDGLRYNGGDMMGGRKHNVYLSYDAKNISINKRMIISQERVSSDQKNDIYVFIN